MLMNLVGPRFTSPPTTQVKASNEQRSGNGLNQAEDLALRQMRDLNTFMGKIDLSSYQLSSSVLKYIPNLDKLSSP